MIEFFECVWPKVRRDLEAFLSVIGGLILLILAIELIGCLFSGAAAACLPVWFEGAVAAVGVFMVFALVALLTLVLVNGAACAIGAGLDALEDFLGDTFDVENANGVSTVTGALTGTSQPTMCEEAQAALARAQQALAAAVAARAAQRERTDRARGRLRAAAAGLAVAIAAALSVPFWRPDLLPGAIAAVVAAVVLVVRRTQRLAAEVNALALSEAAVVRAAAAVAAASALVAVLCGASSGMPTTNPPKPGDSVNPPGGIATASTLKG